MLLSLSFPLYYEHSMTGILAQIFMGENFVFEVQDLNGYPLLTKLIENLKNDFYNIEFFSPKSELSRVMTLVKQSVVYM